MPTEAVAIATIPGVLLAVSSREEFNALRDLADSPFFAVTDRVNVLRKPRPAQLGEGELDKVDAVMRGGDRRVGRDDGVACHTRKARVVEELGDDKAARQPAAHCVNAG